MDSQAQDPNVLPELGLQPNLRIAKGPQLLGLPGITKRVLNKLRVLPGLQDLQTPGCPDGSLFWCYQPPDKLVAPVILYAQEGTCVPVTIAIPVLPHLWTAEGVDTYLQELSEVLTRALRGEAPAPKSPDNLIVVPKGPIPNLHV